MTFLNIYSFPPHEMQMFSAVFFPHFSGKLGTLETMEEPPRQRVGRAGRFGTKGLALTFVATEEDLPTFPGFSSTPKFGAD